MRFPPMEYYKRAMGLSPPVPHNPAPVGTITEADESEYGHMGFYGNMENGYGIAGAFITPTLFATVAHGSPPNRVSRAVVGSKAEGSYYVSDLIGCPSYNRGGHYGRMTQFDLLLANVDLVSGSGHFAPPRIGTSYMEVRGKHRGGRIMFFKDRKPHNVVVNVECAKNMVKVHGFDVTGSKSEPSDSGALIYIPSKNGGDILVGLVSWGEPKKHIAGGVPFYARETSVLIQETLELPEY